MEKLLVIASLGREVHRMQLFQRMLLRGSLIIGILLLTTFLAGTWLMVLLYAAYLSLLKHGLAPELSLISIGLVALYIIILLGLTARQQAREIAHMVAPPALPSRLLHAYHAFMDGLRKE